MKVEQHPPNFVVTAQVSEDSDRWVVRVSLGDKFVKFEVTYLELMNGFGKDSEDKYFKAKELLLKVDTGNE